MEENVYVLSLDLNKSEAVYKVGETIKFFPHINVNSRVIPEGQLKWTLVKNFYTPIDEGTIELGVPGSCVCVAADEPCVYQCKMVYSSPEGNDIEAMTGAAVSPEKIKQNWDVPTDFDAFWDRQKARLADVPLNAELTPINSVNDTAFDIKVDCVDNVPVSGIFMVPENTESEKYPAIISLHGAGVRSSNYADCQILASQGFMVLDINAHGLDNLMPPASYIEVMENELPEYRHEGFYEDTPDNIYFVNMFLRVKRAIDFMTSRPEWDGKNLFLIGASQGAFQTFAGAYLDDRVTAIAAGVPAGSNIAEGGWPYCGDNYNNLTDEQLTAMQKNAPYVDNLSFASKTKVPLTMTVGLIDDVCRPDGVFAVYNAYQGPKQYWAGPKMPHAQDPWLWQQCIDKLMTNLK